MNKEWLPFVLALLMGASQGYAQHPPPPEEPAALDHPVPLSKTAHERNPDVADNALAIARTPACPGDFDGNGTVGLNDFLAFAASFGAVRGDANYNASTDMDGSGAIDLADFVAFAAVFGSDCPPPPLSDDRPVLVALYHATGGPNWTNDANWLSDAPLNQWHGVGTNARGEVTGLDLRENNLQGPIPPELARLQDLTYLGLGSNQLSGPIPPELAQLQDLTGLSLSSNQLSGPIPPELGQLRNLRSLRLQFNQLSGPIPPELGQLQNLWSLGLQFNQLSGPIPPELAQLQDTNFYTLHLENNQLSGLIPPELGQLQNLHNLLLQNNQLSGPIPPELGQLQNLSILLLYNNQLSGPILPEFGQMRYLRRLELHNNQLSGPIPPELGQLQNLIHLMLLDNQLSGPIPPELGQLKNLSHLILSGNQLSGNVPSTFGDLANLRVLNLANNADMAGTLPLALTRLSLVILQLGDTQLCAPEDAAFRNWLSPIISSRVARCATAVGGSRAYLTQATQSLKYPVPLVAGDDALLRVFVTSDADARMPPVRATFYQDGTEAHTVDIPGSGTPVPAEIDEGNLQASANARIPGSVLTPGLEMVIEIDPQSATGPSAGIADRLPPTGRTAVDVREMPPFDLTLVPFLWTENPDRSILSRLDSLTAESDLFRLTRDLLPVGELTLNVRKAVWTSTEPVDRNVRRILSETLAIREMDGASGYYMGTILDSGGIAMQGRGFRTIVSSLSGPTIAHELGHVLTLGHAPCGVGDIFDPGYSITYVDKNYPYPDGSIGAWGYDQLEKRLVNPTTHFDLMSYCGPIWVSDYYFSQALRHRLALYRQETSMTAALAPPAGSLLLWGGVDERGQIVLEPSFAIVALPSLPRTDGPYQILGEDRDGGALFGLSFGMAEGADGAGGAFAFVLPARSDWPGRLTRITLSGPEGVATAGGAVDADAPAVALLRDSATGRVRGILRDWPEPGLDMVVSRGVPDPADWRW